MSTLSPTAPSLIAPDIWRIELPTPWPVGPVNVYLIEECVYLIEECDVLGHVDLLLDQGVAIEHDGPVKRFALRGDG